MMTFELLRRRMMIEKIEMKKRQFESEPGKWPGRSDRTTLRPVAGSGPSGRSSPDWSLADCRRENRQRSLSSLCSSR